MVTELEKSRAFVGQTEEQRRNLEGIIKSRYTISDSDIGGALGYRVHDHEKGNQIYFHPNSRLTLETRYLEKDEDRKASENVLDLFVRVAVNIAEADLKYNTKKDIQPVAEEFLEALIYQQFMPNTPTLCNAGRALQQLSACFVLPVEDYLATDDIGEDPEKQGTGIYDSLRYMAMVHKSGGGTGFNFSHLRPRADRISTTFGSASGPVSFIKVFDASTSAVNQGGFRRGANMGILNYNHPDIFEFVGEKARNHSLENFNLSVGVDDEFISLLKNDGYFRLINPKDEKRIPLEGRIWKKDNVLSKQDPRYDSLFKELDPSLVIEENGVDVINIYTEEVVGKVDDDGSILIRARSLFDYIAKNAWDRACPGIIFLDRLERNNKTPHIGKIESTNPCGEQPLLPFEACNLGAINLASCITAGAIDYKELDKRIEMGVHFLDNVIDMSKFPFQKVYGIVHGTRKIGLGLMGWAEMLIQLGIPYDSEEAVKLAGELSDYITETARKKSQELTEERGVFPYWEGSVYEELGLKVRNATLTTIAPNGTTSMIANVTGGIEPIFKLVFKKTCMDGKELIYRSPLLIRDLQERFGGERLENILRRIDVTGSIQDIEEISDDLKRIYKASHEISPEWHVRTQAAFQKGGKGIGVDNAVSKTVNLPEEATVEDVKRIYQMAYDEGCMGITIFRAGSRRGVYSGLEQNLELIQNTVIPPQMVEIKAQAIKYKIKRPQSNDSLHVTLTSDIWIDDKTKKAYFIPAEIFQERTPLGHATSVSFAQSGIDRTEVLKGPDPDYAEFIKRLQSAYSNEEEGIGPLKIKSIEHAVGIIMEDYFLRNGIVGYEDGSNQLINLIRKPNLRRVKEGTDEYKTIMSQVRVTNSEGELIVSGNQGKLGRKFVCERCHGEEYIFESGCNKPKCKTCGEIEDGGCG